MHRYTQRFNLEKAEATQTNCIEVSARGNDPIYQPKRTYTFCFKVLFKIKHSKGYFNGIELERFATSCPNTAETKWGQRATFVLCPVRCRCVGVRIFAHQRTIAKLQRF